MTNPLNGSRKLAVALGIIGGFGSILIYAGGVYTGWKANVDASVVQREMVNRNDSVLKGLVPEVEILHEHDALQQKDIDENARDIAALTQAVKQTNDLLQLYLQSMMKRGEISR